jgi:hypothetical protein
VSPMHIESLPMLKEHLTGEANSPYLPYHITPVSKNLEGAIL